MSWIRIDDNAPFHRKQIEAGPAACWLWLCGLGYGQRLNTDVIPDGAVAYLGVGNYRRLAGFLVASGLWHKVDGGYRIHDFHDFHETPEERSQKQEKRKDRNMRYYRRLKSASQDGLKTCLKSPTQDGEPAPAPAPTPTPTPQPRSAAAGLVMSPLEFAKAQERCSFIGARLQVPKKLHGDFRRDLGGRDTEIRLFAWYGAVDEEIERTGEPIVPDIWKWLTARFRVWAGGMVENDLMEKFRPNGA